MNEPCFLNTVRDHNKYNNKKLYLCHKGAFKGLFWVFGSVLVNQPTVHSGELARAGSVAVAVSVGNRGNVTSDM